MVPTSKINTRPRSKSVAEVCVNNKDQITKDNMRPRSKSVAEAIDNRNLFLNPDLQTANSEYFHSAPPQSSLPHLPFSMPVPVVVPTLIVRETVSSVHSDEYSPREPFFSSVIVNKKLPLFKRILIKIKENPKTFLALIFPITTIPTLIFILVRYIYNNSKTLTVDAVGRRPSSCSIIPEYLNQDIREVDGTLILDDDREVDGTLILDDEPIIDNGEFINSYVDESSSSLLDHPHQD